ncbi:acyl-CoA thioesterase [Rhodococcus sp. H36-A4]|uniref:acyl-CoA thioesterase n=1 Tax=Rhodococcus sp. H36-A4 TaxID=3004353 RepID=UPI0022AFB171|nr:hotdog domain-containing protein [Rhodococcus sp. H36-A4]MCZ4078071.1 acyl-CoA thioesterase [Rhodococcus sp. H36-A4]
MVGHPTSQTFTLAYGDCDAIGISYFAMNYPWMERTYSVWLHSHGLDSHTMMDTIGVGTVGFGSECSYLAMCRVFDEVTCGMELNHIGTSSYIIGFAFTRGEERVAYGKIKYAVRGPDGLKASIPDVLRAALVSLDSR